MNLRDSGWDVSILLRSNSPSKKLAEEYAFKTLPLSQISEFSIVAVLISDDGMPNFYEEVKNNFVEGQTLVFAHGYSIHYKTVPWPKDLNWILLAPKGIGSAVREKYLEGSGVPCVLSIENSSSQKDWETADLLAHDLGFSKVGVYPATAKDEVEADLFSEQALLCGGVPALVAEAYDILVKEGISPEVAYLECVHELAFIVDLFQKQGIHKTLLGASGTAQFGGVQAARKLITPELRKNLEEIFEDVRRGRFAESLKTEANQKFKTTRKALQDVQELGVEEVGEKIRAQLTKGDAA